MKDDIRTTHAMRLGFRQISGLSEDDGRAIAQARGAGFDSIRDLWLRTRLTPSVLERLADADAFRSLGLDRRDALWAVRALQRSGDKDDLPLFARRRHAGAGARRRAAADAARRACGRGLSPPAVCRSKRIRCRSCAPISTAAASCVTSSSPAFRPAAS